MVKSKKRLKKKLKLKAKFRKTALHSETKKGILAIVCFALAILSFLSFFNGAGKFGQYFLKISQLLFGQGFFLVSIVFILIGLAIFIPRLNLGGQQRPVYRTIIIGAVLFVLSILGIFHIFGQRAVEVAPEVSLGNSGGYLGLILGYPLINYLGFWASLVVLLSLLIISILITFNVPLKIPFRQLAEEEKIKPGLAEEKKLLPLVAEKKKSFWYKLKEKAKEGIKKSREEKLKKDELAKEKQIAGQPAKEVIPSAVSAGQGQLAEGKDLTPQEAGQPATDFKLPSLNFLEKDKGQPTSGDIKANINIIKRTLENFGIEVEMAEVNVGPTVTQYTLRPAQGIKLARITALQNDLALALAAHPLRLETPIPGRPLVGIEIPNRSVVLVRLRSLLERPTFEKAPSFLTFALGRDVAGNPIFANLAQMPHLLVAGATGTGKTIALNNLIVSLLYRNFPENIKFILIDPKRVELTAYNSIPYLLTPVVVQADKAIGALRWAVGEMERRFEVLQEANQRDIDAYNNRSLDENNQRLSYIVIVIDELADLMASHGREVEASIVRLAQMARAVGIHLVVSTQRPSVEVITGLIKANITSRIAFQVASQVDSRTILDMAGAEKLLGNGDMLFLAGNSAKPRRVQGAYISDREVKKVTDYLKKTREPEYNEEVTVGRGFPSEMKLDFGLTGSETDDELYEEAKEVITQAGKASASLLQRRLRIGYARAARLLDMMEERGIVGPADGAKPREVFIDEGEEQEIG
jgi:S-DNA-T family DNA segregation ATPase FtsK/SpoIIIE